MTASGVMSGALVSYEVRHGIPYHEVKGDTWRPTHI